MGGVSVVIDKPAEKLKLLRMRKGWTQEKLVEVLKEKNPKLRVYQVMISRYEKNKEEPGTEIKQAINEIFGQSLWE